MQIEHLHYFKTVAACGSMNKAAQQLFCSQPTITTAIKNLETELGAPLLERTPKGVAPTELGQLVLQDSNLILGCVERWKQSAQTYRMCQPITITMTGTAPRYHLVQYILQIRKQHPELDVRLRQAAVTPGEVSFANEENFRIGISYRVPQHIGPTLQFAERHGLQLSLLQRDEFCLFLNCNHPLAAIQEDLVLSDLHGMEIMLYHDPQKFPYIDALSTVNCGIGAQMWHEENLMLALALDDRAMAFRPRRIADHNQYVEDGRILVRSIADCPMPVDLCLFAPTPDRATEAEALFLQNFKTFFPEYELLGETDPNSPARVLDESDLAKKRKK